MANRKILAFLLFMINLTCYGLERNELVWMDYSSKILEEKGEQYFNGENANEDSAIVCFTIIANRYSHKISVEETQRCINALCRLWYLYFYHYFDYTSSYVCIMRAMEIGKERGIENAETYMNLGSVYQTLADENGEKKNYEIACRYFLRSFFISHQQKQWVLMTLSYTNLLDIAAKIGNIDSVRRAAHIYNNVSVIKKGIYASTFIYNKAMWNILKCRDKGDYKKALQWHNDQLSHLSHTHSDSRFLFNAYTDKAATCAKMGDYEEAIAATRKSLEVAKEFEMKDGLTEGYRHMEEYMRKKGEDEEAFAYKQLYLDVRGELQNYSQLMSSGEYHILSVVNNVNVRMKDMERARTIQTIIIITVCCISACVVFFLIAIRRKNKELRNRNEVLFDKYTALVQQDKTTKEKYQNSKLDESDKERLAQEIRRILSSDAIYDSSFSLSCLSKNVGSNSAYVSQVINEVMGQNFRSLLTSARIQEACRRLSDDTMVEKYSIEGIGRSVGFNSRSTFVATFKKETGLTATEYRRIALDKKNK